MRQLFKNAPKGLVLVATCFLLAGCDGSKPSKSDAIGQIGARLGKTQEDDYVRVGFSDIEYENGFASADNMYVVVVTYKETTLESGDTALDRETQAEHLDRDGRQLLGRLHLVEKGAETTWRRQFQFLKTENGWVLQ